MINEELEKVFTEGIVFRGAKNPRVETKSVKSKAKKSTYVKGLHGSGSAKQKAKYKARRQAKSAR
ncbi:MAG: hypothetical protein ACRC6R_04390 [Bacteroidales bacterium]